MFDALGVEVDGFLGYPFYRRFFTVVDAAAGRWEFFPYTDLPHVPAGEWDRVGVEIAREGGAAVIDMTRRFTAPDTSRSSPSPSRSRRRCPRDTSSLRG